MKTDSTATARRFARHFATYPDEAVVQRHTADALVEALRAEASGPCFPHVVELGCGTGLLTRAFLRAFKCEALPPTDLVLSASCLQWLRDPERLFRVVAASLPKCGLFAAATFSAGNLSELEQCGGQPLTCPAARRWREMLEASGFEIRRFEARTVRLSFPSALDALRHLKRTGVLTPALGGYRDARRFLARYETLRDSHGVPLTYTPVFWVAAKA